MHITGILHKNFGTSKPVGHVGSSVLKKAETVAFIESAEIIKKDDTKSIITTVKCEYSRNMPFKDIVFDVNADWLPFEVDQSVGDKLPKNKTVTNF
jgi:hypothetical protein